ncbi:MAG: HAMP domain-containing sensor histidine kinase [Eubacteriales bacterium]|nr:HAMP domain-containing sensor histidine kinase [Eubacteriales bacterium]
MFRKLQRKLAFLCGVISSAVLCVFSAAFLLVSENSQRQSNFLSFQSDMNTLLANLEMQQTLSHTWLKQMENRKYQIYITDGDFPLFFTKLNFSAQELDMIDQIVSHYREGWLDRTALTESSSLHTEFPWNQKKGGEPSFSHTTHYIGCMSYLKNGSCITAVVLFPQDALHNRLLLQRIVFLIMDLLGCLIFFAFSWLLTGRLLKPVEEGQKRQTDFIAAASHELRTPLSVILSSAAACEIAPPADQKRFFSNIRREGKRMQSLLSDMLLLADRPDKSPSLMLVPTDPETLLIGLYENFQPLAREKQLSLSLDLPGEELPPCSWDAEKITQMLSVLLQNAVCYTPAGGTITLRARVKGGKMLLSVADTGCGIPDAEKERIFDRFYRCESSRSQREHFGLGLSVALDIARAHRGSIRAQDQTPCGSVFTVTLPLHLPGV